MDGIQDKPLYPCGLVASTHFSDVFYLQKRAATEDGLAFARDVYARARPGYHSTTRAAIDAVLGEASG